MFVVVAYDVVKNRRRGRFYRALRKILPRAQKSVFEGPLDAREVEAVREAASRMLDLHADTVRIYRLCPQCARRTEVIGAGERLLIEPEDAWVD